MQYKSFQKVIYLLLTIVICACQPKNIPDEVNSILELSGENNNELIKAIKHYQKSDDTFKLHALYFLISN